MSLVGELGGGYAHTRRLLQLRWRFARTLSTRAGLVTGALIFATGLVLFSNVGTLIRMFAEQGIDTAAGQYAVNYLVAFQRGDLGVVGATALGSIVLAALLSPFTGVSSNALFAADNLTGLRPVRLHRYFDSVITTAFSAIGILQLFTLSTITSLLTLNGGHANGLLFTWCAWPVLILVSVTEGWVLEYLHRTYGPRVRRTGLAVFTAGLAVALALDPNHGRTLFGVGNLFSTTIEAVAKNDQTYMWLTVLTLLGIAIVTSTVGIIACRRALALPAPVTRREGQVRVVRISENPRVSLAQMMLLTMVRTPEIRRPLLTIVAIAVPAVWISHAASTAITTVVLAVPATVALSWGINVFGLLGSGMPWLAAQPNVTRYLMTTAVAIQVMVTAAIEVVVWVPVIIAGYLDWGTVLSIVLGTIVAVSLTVHSATDKSVRKPFPVTLGTRGDMTVPPATALNYTLRFTLWSGQLGLLTLHLDDHLFQLAAAFLAVAYATVRLSYLNRRWLKATTQAVLIPTVSAT